MVHWTFTVSRRATGWLTPAFHSTWREILLHACARYELLCPAYVLMPDHAHLMLIGLNEILSDQRTAIAFIRKHTAGALAPHKWQRQAHDHILRKEERLQEAFSKTCHYIAANPVRKNLCADPAAWPYLGCIAPGYPDLSPTQPDYWDLFWRIHAHLLNFQITTR